MYWSVNVSVWKYINLKVYQSESVPIRKCTSLYTHILPAKNQLYYFWAIVQNAVETTGLNPLFIGIYKVLKLWKTTFRHMVTLPCDVGYYGMSYHIYKNISKNKECKKKTMTFFNVVLGCIKVIFNFYFPVGGNIVHCRILEITY